MACASGKTLVGMRLAEHSRRILILEPSLPLIRQAIDEARLDGLLANRTVICVCSDKSIASDDRWQVTDEELGFPVTTDLATLRTLLGESGNQCVVFCTYYSQPLLRSALPNGFRFDFGIFDEAHRTAGVRERTFSVALSDDHVPISKRLFLTATPRFFPEDDDRDVQLAYSMDDDATYGPLAYELTLPDAIKRGIVCDYEVLTACVTGTDVQDAIRRASDLFLPQKNLPVELVAGQIAVLRAIQATEARRVITFHATIEDAASFAKDRLKIYRRAGIAVFHINGNMPGKQRRAVIDAFLAVDGPSLLTNCHCLTEGVDVPEIDMVGILCRKESVMEIVQAVGRALRNRPGKERGYVMLPLYADDNEPMESALGRSDMAVTWEILHSVLEAGDTLADRLTGVPHRSQDEPLRHSAHHTRGRHRAVAPALLLDDLQRAISVRYVNRLGERWDETLEAARRFAAREGSLLIPPDHIEEGFALGHWLESQRQLRKRGRLSARRIKELEALGVVWSTHDAAWLTGLRLAQLYYHRHGNLDIPSSETTIRAWLDLAQSQAKNGAYPLSKREAFKSLGIELPLSRTVEEKLAALERWRQANPVGRPSRTGPDKRLVFFLRYMNRRAKAGELEQSVIDRLARIGMDLAATRQKELTGHQKFGEKSWDLHYDALKDYVESHGWQNLWSSSRHNGLAIQSWVRNQRYAQRKGLLSAERFAALDALGMNWNGRNTWWVRWVEQLETFYQNNGHLRIPSKGELAQLSVRVSLFRQLIIRGKASDDLVVRLRAINFPETKEEASWQYAIAGLRKWKEANPVVPISPRALPNDLRNFFYKMKALSRRGQLSDSRRLALRDLGVPWAAQDSEHVQMLERLKLLAKEVGKVNVEVMAYRDHTLTQWLENQIAAAAAGTLASNAVIELRNVGIDIGETMSNDAQLSVREAAIG